VRGFQTGSSDENGGKENDNSDMKKTGATFSGRSGDADGLRSRQLPPPPVDQTQLKRPPPGPRDLQSDNAELNASRQSFRMAMGNNCE